MSSRAIVTAFHKYQPYGNDYYSPILLSYIDRLQKLRKEYDQIYLIDSTWNIDPQFLPSDLPITVLRGNPHRRYYDAYKDALPQIKEDLLLFMDNDMVVYREGMIEDAFKKLSSFDVVSIYDSIGEKADPRLNGKSKFCLYWFAIKKELLERYVNCEWGPVPWGETLSELTFKMLDDGVVSYEWPEDKGSIYLIDNKIVRDPDIGKNLGYYHIRAGSVPSVLLAYRTHDQNQYNSYLKYQPKQEYLRQFAWYWYMDENLRHENKVNLVLKDVGISGGLWDEYVKQFMIYHGLYDAL